MARARSAFHLSSRMRRRVARQYFSSLGRVSSQVVLFTLVFLRRHSEKRLKKRRIQPRLPRKASA